MKIILVRHLESIKNLENNFASNENLEGLTHDAFGQGDHLSSAISKYIKSYSLKIRKVYCASSVRATTTAQIIAAKIGVDIMPFESLNSIKHDTFSGMTENEIGKIDPEFIYQLRLYRLGLYNSYQIKHHTKNELVKDFEERVNKTLQQILVINSEESAKVIILHRSSLLASLFAFVRKYYDFPKDFYGYVEIGVGNISILSLTSNNLMIEHVNVTPYNLDQQMLFPV